MHRVVVALFGLCLAAPRSGRACPDRAAWPTREWPSAAADAERAEAVAALERFAFTLTGVDRDRLGPRTDAILIVHRGQIVYERYARGFAADRPHYAWSVAKTVVNALTGIAVERRALRLSDSVCQHVRLPRSDHCDITVQHLLEFSSGLDWQETYEGQSNQRSSVLAMLYGVGHRDMMRFVAAHASRDAPGTSYQYSSGDTTFLAGVVNAALGRAFGPGYARALLFDVVGMTSARFERDAAGTPVGSSWFYATARDLARLGYLFLSDGCWEGGRLLPEGWVKASTEVSRPFERKRLELEPGDVQGRQLWLNRPVPTLGLPVPWKDVPDDAFAARGHWGQSVVVIPSRDLVIVRLADDRAPGFDFNRFVALAMAVAG